MSDSNDILELRRMIADARELLTHAANWAVEISGYSGGREADPEHGCPEILPSDGDPVLLALADALVKADGAVAAAVTPEFEQRCRDAAEYLDDLADLADGASY